MTSLDEFREQHPQYNDMSDKELVNRLHEKFYADIPKAEFVDRLGAIDKKSGAPAKVRMMVGSAPDQDRLATLKRFYPDASPFGRDNFIFTDSRNGKPTLYNPKGMDAGDVASVAREGAQAVGGTLGAVGGAIGGAAVGLAGGPAAPVTVPAGAVAGGVAGSVIGAGAGTAVADSLFDIAYSLAGGVDTRSLPKRAAETAVNFAGGAIGQRGGELLEQGVKNVIGAGRAMAAKRAADFAGAGVQPPAGAVTGSRMIQGTEQMLRDAPGSATVMQKATETALGQVRAEATRLAARYGDPLAKKVTTQGAANVRTGQGAGETIVDAAKGAGERIKEMQEKAYTKVSALIGPDTPVPVPSVIKLRQTLEAALAKAPESQKRFLAPAIKQIKAHEADAAAHGGIPFETLRQIRTAIGQDIDAPLLAGSSGAQNVVLKRVYGALSDDIEAAAKAASPDAARALAVADRFTRQKMREVIPTLQKIANLDADEKAFGYVMNSAKEGGTKLATLRRNFKPEEWDTVAATVLGRMGQAKAGAQDAAGDAFSVSTFLTNYNTMSQEARIVLFAGTRYKKLRPELDRLVRVVGAMKETEKLANTSGTGRSLMFGALLGGLVTGDVAGASAGGLIAGAGRAFITQKAAAKLITHPSFVQWLVRAVPASAKTHGIPEHLGRLAAIGAANPEIKEEIGQYLSALRGAPEPVE